MKKFILVFLLLCVTCLIGCKEEELAENEINLYQATSEEFSKISEFIVDYEENSTEEIETKAINTQEKSTKQTEYQEAPNIEEENAKDSDIQLLEKIKKNKIDERSVEVSLNNWGEVMFVSCMPDFDENIEPLTDISFYLVSDAKVLYHFPDVAPNNIRESGRCEGVSILMFEDINGDELKDIVIGVLYISGAGPQGMIPYTEIRIYEADGTEFIYNKDLCDEINMNHLAEVTEEDLRVLLKD